MKRVIYLFVLLLGLELLSLSTLQAQDKKWRVGFTLAPTYNFSEGILYAPSTSAVIDSLANASLGWKGGVEVEYLFSKHSMLHVGLNLHNKNYTWGTALEDIEISTIEMPILYKLEGGLGKLFRLFFYGGGSLEYNFQARLQDLEDLTPDLSKMTSSAVLGTGASLNLGFGYLKFGASYFIGLNELLNSGDIQIINPDHLSIDIGFSFN